MKKSQLRQIIKEEISRVLKEGLRTVNRGDWEAMNSEEKINALLTASKDPDVAEELVNVEWDMLPELIKNNMKIMPSEYFNPRY